MKSDPYVLNDYECGCRIVSELKGGLGFKIIDWCPLHKNAELLWTAANAVEKAFSAGHHPTFEQIEKLTTALYATQLERKAVAR